MEPHLLVVDDDERIRSLLQQFLVQDGYLISTAENAEQARILLSGIEFDLIILDVMMPGQDGISFAGELRNLGNNTPILLLTARGETEDRIKGLEAGADDYLPKPFEPKELLLRINAILRRMPDLKEDKMMPKTLDFGNLKYDVARNELWDGEKQVRLTTTESQLMKIFTSALGEPISRADLVMSLGRDVSLAQDRAIDVQITRLRRKIEVNPSQPRYLQTVRGAGYMLLFD
ncbi:response regulator [Paracoccaceae bacterium]|jgi:two-component system phosphate regulon response regulator OmpR|nr:response regulator [Paracoccaceae bacterium]MDA9612973.1 response regulator [Paracoccaceae bacterium]MDA9666401.1 response regulator [bacterium]MDA9670992.1 response regulator [Paracoccaceae bacterium]|tara:strand:- start:1023 stop:1718 length:696 start_codon:yes stop_codon:yes gene_type:complete